MSHGKRLTINRLLFWIMHSTADPNNKKYNRLFQTISDRIETICSYYIIYIKHNKPDMVGGSRFIAYCSGLSISPLIPAISDIITFSNLFQVSNLSC